jgi:hypothetical protein
MLPGAGREASGNPSYLRYAIRLWASGLPLQMEKRNISRQDYVIYNSCNDTVRRISLQLHYDLRCYLMHT